MRGVAAWVLLLCGLGGVLWFCVWAMGWWGVVAFLVLVPIAFAVARDYP